MTAARTRWTTRPKRRSDPKHSLRRPRVAAQPRGNEPGRLAAGHHHPGAAQPRSAPRQRIDRQQRTRIRSRGDGWGGRTERRAQAVTPSGTTGVGGSSQPNPDATSAFQHPGGPAGPIAQQTRASAVAAVAGRSTAAADRSPATLADRLEAPAAAAEPDAPAAAPPPAPTLQPRLRPQLPHCRRPHRPRRRLHLQEHRRHIPARRPPSSRRPSASPRLPAPATPSPS